MTRPDIPSDAELHMERLTQAAMDWSLHNALQLSADERQQVVEARWTMANLMLALAVRLEAGK